MLCQNLNGKQHDDKIYGETVLLDRVKDFQSYSVHILERMEEYDGNSHNM